MWAADWCRARPPGAGLAVRPFHWREYDTLCRPGRCQRAPFRCSTRCNAVDAGFGGRPTKRMDAAQRHIVSAHDTGGRDKPWMRVLHVVAPSDVGGLERVVQLLALGQARTGTEVHVAAMLDAAHAAHPLVAALTAGGVTTHPIVLPGRRYWRERQAMLELGRRLRPAVVHTHGYRPDVLDAGPARRLGIPTVTTVHGFTGGDWKNRFYERLQRRAHRSFDAVVGVSRPLVAQLIRDGVPAPRAHFVQNAWEATAPPLERGAARRALGLGEGGFVVGWAGRLSREKAADALLDALVHLTDLPLTVCFLGGGQEHRSLAARTRDLDLGHRVRWHGVVPEAGRLFAAFDVFVLSSRTEGTPLVLFEAMAVGVPIVATRVGGVPDVVSAAEAALVPADDPAALAAEIRAVYRNGTAAARRAHAAHARLARDFNVAPWLERYDAIYAQVASGAPTPVLT
jgi:glycosyltransferase involved in cell wall biosynthesis